MLPLALQTLVLAPRLWAPRLAWAKTHHPERHAREIRRQRRAPPWIAFGAAWHLPPAVILVHHSTLLGMRRMVVATLPGV